MEGEGHGRTVEGEGGAWMQELGNGDMGARVGAAARGKWVRV